MEPSPIRPYMPGYGILSADEGTGLLAWSWAVERISGSRYYWISTVRPNGQPHLMPVWGVWMQEQVWFSSSGASRKALNIGSNPWVVVSTDDATEPVVVEGSAHRVSSVGEPELVHEFARPVNAKYETEYPAEFFLENATIRVRPERVIAMTESEFESSPTRWTFG